jgi:hypothetical protein
MRQALHITIINGVQVSTAHVQKQDRSLLWMLWMRYTEYLKLHLII